MSLQAKFTDSTLFVEGNGVQLMEYSLESVTEGKVYRMYIVAENAQGRSAASPILSVVAGMLPGVEDDRTNSYASVKPSIQAIDSTALTLSWAMPASDATGGTPTTGYKVYMYPGVGLNTLANPTTVFNEEQLITTSVDPQTPEVQEASIENLGTTNNFAISIEGVQGDYSLNYNDGSGDGIKA